MADATPPPANTPEPINSSTDIDPSFYTWQTWFKALSGSITTEERQKYMQARDVIKEESDCKRCEKQRDWLFEHSECTLHALCFGCNHLTDLISGPIITFLRREIRSLGKDTDINSTNVRCRRCTTTQGGGFDPDYGILICANEIRNRKRLEDTMAHEMVHAYDHVRFKMDTWNLRHQACTEVCHCSGFFHRQSKRCLSSVIELTV
jgi:inner membrane protease ATP23